MHNFPRQKLRTLVQEYGAAIVKNPKRCRALLMDYCGAYPSEVNVLVKAQEEDIPKRLQATQGTPANLHLAQLARCLSDTWKLETSAATWAVESWALALGIVSTHEEKSPHTGRDNGRQRHPLRNLQESVLHKIPWGLVRTAGIRLVKLLAFLISVVSVAGSLIKIVAPSRPAEGNTSPPQTAVRATPAESGRTGTPILQLPQGRINCSGTKLTLDLFWLPPGTEKHDTHYRYELYSGSPSDVVGQLIASGDVMSQTVSVDLPCETSAWYHWRVKATGAFEAWSDMINFGITCRQQICRVVSYGN